MGDLTLAEVGRTLARIEEAQTETSKQVAELAKTVHIALHGPTDQSHDHPVGLIPRLLRLEQHYREQHDSSKGSWERIQAGLIAGVVSVLVHVVQNLDYMRGNN